MSLFSFSILLPVIFFLMLFLHGTAAWGDPTRGRDWPFAFLVAAVVWGVMVALSTELLSLGTALSRVGIALFWLAGLGGLLLWTGGGRTFREGFVKLRDQLRRLALWEWGLLIGLAALSALLLAVAWISPPNNVDSLLYHMSRVMHWAQNQSVAHYPAVFHHQLNMPPWSEEAILHLRVLFGDDRPAALVQWFSMLGSLVGVSYLAKRLGAGRAGQALAVVFAATIPMGILQATSTQNDYVVAFWLTTSLAFAIDVFEPDGSWVTDVRVGAAAGLGLLTKATFYIYGLPVVAGYLLVKFVRRGWRRAWLGGLVLAVAVVSLNLGYWVRNIETFGGPLGGIRSNRSRLPDIGMQLFPQGPEPVPASEIKSLGQLVLTSEGAAGPSPPSGLANGVELSCCCQRPGVQFLASGIDGDAWRFILSLMRQSANEILLHLVMPSSQVNELIEAGLRQLPWLVGGDYFAERSAAAWNHEDTAGNPLHLALIIIGLPILLVGAPSDDQRKRVFWYVAVVIIGFLMLTSFFEVPRIFSLRYHLGFFVAIAAAMGLAFEPIINRGVGYLIPIGLVAALPWLLLNNMRPVVGMPPWPTRTESVFQIPKQEALLAIAPHAVDDYSAAAGRIEEAQCRDVGLAIGQQDLEYAFWWLLDAPQSGVRLEVINPSPETADYVDPDFEPCAVLCTRCQGVQELDGFEFAGEFDNYDLYIVE